MKPNDKNKPTPIDDIPKEVIAEINNVVTSEDPEVFMPALLKLDRKGAMVMLELIHRGKVAASYHAYGYVLILCLSGSQAATAGLFSQGLSWIREEIERDINNNNKKNKNNNN